MNGALSRTITIALWAVVASALVSALLNVLLKILLYVVTLGMLCDGCSGLWDVAVALGLDSIAVMVAAGALALVVWHRDRWPYTLLAPAFLVGVLIVAPVPVRHHWFWWIDCFSLPAATCLLRS